MKNNKFIYLISFVIGGLFFYLSGIFENKIVSFLTGSFLFVLLFFIYIKTNKYIRQCFYDLLNKVTWPTWKELQNSSVVVAVTSLIIAGIIYLMDSVFSSALDLYYSFFG